MKHKRLVLVPLVLVILGAAGIGWYLYQANQNSSNGKIEGSGTIEAVDLNISSRLSAEVKAVKVREGEHVKKGDVLVVLDDSILKDQVAAAKAGVEAAQATLDDAQTNSEKKLAEAQLQQAKANLSMAEIQASYAIIKSPIDGSIISLPVLEGEVASPGSTLAVIGKTSELDLTIYVDEKELGRVKIGDEAKVEVDSYPNKHFKGKVIEIASEPEFTPQNVQTKEQRTNLVFAVTIRVDNKNGLLKPGMPADAILMSGE
ncbi:MAG: efflux RND transporter periplasmic adaptor subunit [Actinomycetota bacterium]|nr:efflux RND transporter periplasmic adaptor subunit [Actinomycetota bacterium]